jgi:hypothetical protein
VPHKKKKRHVIVKEEFRTVRACREENVQYLNYLLEVETWEFVFKQTSVNDAYNEYLGIFQYYYDIAMPRKMVKIKQQKNKWITSSIRVSCIKLRFLNKLMKQIYHKNLKNSIVGTKNIINLLVRPKEYLIICE